MIDWKVREAQRKIHALIAEGKDYKTIMNSIRTAEAELDCQYIGGTLYRNGTWHLCEKVMEKVFEPERQRELQKLRPAHRQPMINCSELSSESDFDDSSEFQTSASGTMAHFRRRQQPKPQAMVTEEGCSLSTGERRFPAAGRGAQFAREIGIPSGSRAAQSPTEHMHFHCRQQPKPQAMATDHFHFHSLATEEGCSFSTGERRLPAAGRGAMFARESGMSEEMFLRFHQQSQEQAMVNDELSEENWT